nr:hypothetical protein [Tanacetum cinerariifolium]
MTTCRPSPSQQKPPNHGGGMVVLVVVPLDSFSLFLHAWYLDDGTINGDTLVVGEVLELIMKDVPYHGLHLNIEKTMIFLPKEDPKSKIAGVFPPNISRTFHGVKLLSGPASVDFDFSNDVLKYGFQSSKLQSASLQMKLLQHADIVTSRPSFDNALYDVLKYGFQSSKLQSASLQMKLLQHADIVTSRPSFDNALCTLMRKWRLTFLKYSKLEEEKACRCGKVYNWKTATYALSCEPTVSPLNDNKTDFRISFDESDDQDYT